MPESDYRPPSKTARRILRHYRSGISYHTLIRLVFPDDASHRPSSNGGPPGCAIAFGRGLRELSAWVSCDSDRKVTIYNAAALRSALDALGLIDWSR
jgi:hypothetical protein